MNKMYDLEVHYDCALFFDYKDRLTKFNRTLIDEVNEIQEIIASDETDPVKILTAIADLLGDVTVFCRSEALKYGIPLEEVLDIIMDSNESKLGADGLPIKNADGKFLKGPNYWKPEPKIEKLIAERLVKYTPVEISSEALELPEVNMQTYGHDTEDDHEEDEVPFQSVVKSSEAMLHARAQLSTEVPNCSALFAAEALAMLDGNEFNHQLREHLTTSQIEQLSMALAFNVAGTYRAMGANGIAQAYDGLYSNYSGRGDKLDDFSCFMMWQFLGYDLNWEAITNKLVELKVYG